MAMVQLRRIARPWSDRNSWTLLIGVLALWVFARILVPGPDATHLPGAWLPSCPLRATTGIPCPFCGITTGCAWVAHGRIADAWRSNILSPILMMASSGVGLYVLVFRLIAGRVVDFGFSQESRQRLWIALGAMATASWVVNLSRL